MGYRAGAGQARSRTDIWGIPWEIFGSSVGVLLAAALAFTLLYHWKDWNSALGLLIGAAFGWALGVFLSPFGPEKELFASYGKAATAFATGFLVSKLDRIFELLVADKAGTGQPLALSTTVWRPFVFALCGLCITALYVFTSRQYGQRASAHLGRFPRRYLVKRPS